MTVKTIDVESENSKMDKKSESGTPLNPSSDHEIEIEPIVYAKFVVANSKFAFGLGLGVHLSMFLLTVILAVSGYDILKFDFTTLPLNLEEDSTKLRTDAWKNVRDDKSVTPSPAFSSGQWQRSVLYQPLEFVYELKGGNVFARENLLTIKKNEEEIFNDATYQRKLCQLDGTAPNQTCKLPLSVLRFFDGTYQDINPVFHDPEFKNITLVFTSAEENNITATVLNFHLGKHAVIDKQKGLVTSKYTRSLFYFGWPINGYKSTEDRDDEQKEELDELIVDTFMDKLMDKYNDKLEGMNFYFFNEGMMKKAMENQVIYDMLLAIASLLFIFLFMWFQTGSLWLTSWAIFGIFSSFNITNLVYRVVFNYKYIGIFHVLSIFIILGIGSDNIFVFMDTWKESGRGSQNSLVNRLSVVYKSAAKATFITSLTTMIAFLSNVISPLLAISSFGLFSAILVAVNYLTAILFFPTVIIRHELSRKGMCLCWEMCRDCRRKKEVALPGLELTENGVPPENSPSNSRNFVIDFLDGWFYKNIVTHKHVRWIVLFFFFVLVSTFIGFAAQLKPDEEQTKIWRENTNWAKIGELRMSAFRSSQEDDIIVVHIIWGLKDQDRSECHHTDYECTGKTVFDKNFDLNPPPCQNAMLDLCKKLKNVPPELEEKLRLRRSGISGEIETQCIFERLEEWLQEESNKTKYPPGLDFTLPVNAKKIVPLMKANPTIYNVTSLPETYYRYFEVALGFFIFDGKSTGYANNYDFEVYSELIGGSLDETISENENYMQGGKYGHRLMFIAVTLNTTLNPKNLPYDVGLPIYDEWEYFVRQQMAEMPPSCNNGFQTTVGHRNPWHWLKVQKILVTSAITGVMVGLLFSSIVLILATTNLIVGVLASFTISLITCAVLGMITILGWKLGMLESLNLTLVVGLAVDYVVHLAEGYMELRGESRLARVRHTLGHVGISVLSGACTTLGASMFMLAAKIVFFFQFGIFMFCTIGFSILFSLLFFTTMLALVGPQEEEKGSILPAIKHTKDYLRGKRRGEVHCERCQGKGFISNDSENYN